MLPPPPPPVQPYNRARPLWERLLRPRMSLSDVGSFGLRDVSGSGTCSTLSGLNDVAGAGGDPIAPVKGAALNGCASVLNTHSSMEM